MPGKPADGLPSSSLAAVLRGNLGYLALVFGGVLLPLWLFAELADEVHEMEALVFDDALLLQLKAWASPAADRLFVWISLAGYRYGVIPVDVVLALALLGMRRWREAAFAIVAFFSRNPRLEGNALVTKVLPVVTGLILAALVIYIAVNFGSIAGASGFLAVFLPALVLIAGIVGLLLAARLKSTDSAGFARLGAGQEA